MRHHLYYFPPHPGDPARLLAGDRASDEMVRHIRQQLGLDLPLWQQFIHYVGDLLQGDLGTSIRTGRPVLADIAVFFPATLELALCALLLALLAGVPLGVLSAVWRNRWLDHRCACWRLPASRRPPSGWGWERSCCFTAILTCCPAADGWTTGSIRRRTSQGST